MQSIRRLSQTDVRKNLHASTVLLLLLLLLKPACQESLLEGLGNK